MATNRVHGGQRIKFTAVVAHKSGELIYHKGFYGIVQDNVKAGDLATLILDGVWRLPYVPATLAMGTMVAALATEQATASLQILAVGGASANYSAIGRTIETGTATTAKIQLFNPRQN